MTVRWRLSGKDWDRAIAEEDDRRELAHRVRILRRTPAPGRGVSGAQPSVRHCREERCDGVVFLRGLCQAHFDAKRRRQWKGLTKHG